MRKLEQNRDALGFRADASSSPVADGHCRVAQHCFAGSGGRPLEMRRAALGESTPASSSVVPDHNADRFERAADSAHSKRCERSPQSLPPADEGSRQEGAIREQSIPMDLTDPSCREAQGRRVQTTPWAFLFSPNPAAYLNSEVARDLVGIAMPYSFSLVRLELLERRKHRSRRPMSGWS